MIITLEDISSIKDLTGSFTNLGPMSLDNPPEGLIRDRAALANPAPFGGIDLNSANLAMLIKRDGRGVVLPIAQQDLAQLSNIEGLEPKILSIIPANQSHVFASMVEHP